MIISKKQARTAFRFVIRPLRTKNVASREIAISLEDEISLLIGELTVVSPISGILIMPILMDEAIATPPSDYVGYKSRDNSVTVSIKIDFALWERSSVLERLSIMTVHVLNSLDKIPGQYLLDQDRQKLRLVVDKVQSRLALRFTE
jgi:hypothetical protein